MIWKFWGNGCTWKSEVIILISKPYQVSERQVLYLFFSYKWVLERCAWGMTKENKRGRWKEIFVGWKRTREVGRWRRAVEE